MSRKRSFRDGFTLAELLVVVAIIGVLVAVSIPIFTGQLEKARQARDLANARNLKAVIAAAILDGDIEFESPDAYVYVSVTREVTAFRAIGNVKIKGNAADNHKKLHDLIAASGMFKATDWRNQREIAESEKYLFVQSRSNTTGWAWYSLYFKGDGTFGIVSGTNNKGKYETNPITSPLSSKGNIAKYF